jgi:hypothetical protein
MRKKAMELWDEMPELPCPSAGFTASHGWLQRWLKRINRRKPQSKKKEGSDNVEKKVCIMYLFTYVCTTYLHIPTYVTFATFTTYDLFICSCLIILTFR